MNRYNGFGLKSGLLKHKDWYFYMSLNFAKFNIVANPIEINPVVGPRPNVWRKNIKNGVILND